LHFDRYVLDCGLPESCWLRFALNHWLHFGQQCLTAFCLADMTAPSGQATANIREASYYQVYQENVVKHRWFLAGEHARKPNPTAQKVRINILQYLIHLRMCKDVPTKMMKMFLLVENLRQQNPDNRFGNPNTGSVTSFGIVISFTDAFSASPSDKKLESHDTLEDRKDLSQPG
nr:hypothetical protein [Tanacetum cinerariifolium]